MKIPDTPPQKLTGYKQRVLDAHSHLHSLHYVMKVSRPEKQGTHEYSCNRGEALQKQRQHASPESPLLGQWSDHHISPGS